METILQTRRYCLLRALKKLASPVPEHTKAHGQSVLHKSCYTEVAPSICLQEAMKSLALWKHSPWRGKFSPFPLLCLPPWDEPYLKMNRSKSFLSSVDFAPKIKNLLTHCSYNTKYNHSISQGPKSLFCSTTA